MTGRSRAAAAALTLALTAALGLAPAASSGSGAASGPAPRKPTMTARLTAANGCPDVLMIFARGTGEDPDAAGTIPGLGAVGTPFASALTQALPGMEVAFEAVDYAADVPQDSTIPGAVAMRGLVADEAASCPGTILVLGGYSQGAAVVDVTLGLGPVTGLAEATAGNVIGGSVLPGLAPAAADALGAALAVQPGIPVELGSNIAAVVTFGNPIRWSGQSVKTASPTYGEAWDDICNPGDPVCDNGTDITAHLTYGTNGSAVQGAGFAAALVESTESLGAPQTG